MTKLQKKQLNTIIENYTKPSRIYTDRYKPFKKRYTTLQNLTQPYKTSQYYYKASPQQTKLHIFISLLTKLYKTLPNVDNFTQLHNTLHNSTTIHNALQHFTNNKKYKVVHNFTNFTESYTTLHNFTKLYKSIHNSTTFLQNGTKLNKIIQNFTNLYNALQKLQIYTQLYKT